MDFFSHYLPVKLRLSMGDCLSPNIWIVNIRRFRTLDFKIPRVTKVAFSQEHSHSHTLTHTLPRYCIAMSVSRRQVKKIISTCINRLSKHVCTLRQCHWPIASEQIHSISISCMMAIWFYCHFIVSIEYFVSVNNGWNLRFSHRWLFVELMTSSIITIPQAECKHIMGQ